MNTNGPGYRGGIQTPTAPRKNIDWVTVPAPAVAQCSFRKSVFISVHP